MALAQQSSTLTRSDASPIATSLEWINDLLFGQVAVSLCVIAVAFVGFQMLTGRWPLRLGFRVILGCFVLLGAPTIAAGLISTFEDRPAVVAVIPVDPAESRRGELEPAEYDPYAGASLRRE
ncbi:MAG: TrbC/VirB2 family protein, partial [Pseudomonadota bacterium]